MLNLFLKKRKGFTLIELLVVIAIIGVLASIVLVSLSSARSKGRDAKRIADMKSFQLALEMTYDAANPPTYPAEIADNALPVVSGITNNPTDPGDYAYTYWSTDGSSFVLRAQLENENSVLDGDVDTNPIQGADCSDSATAWFYCITP